MSIKKPKFSNENAKGRGPYSYLWKDHSNRDDVECVRSHRHLVELETELSLWPQLLPLSVRSRRSSTTTISTAVVSSKRAVKFLRNLQKGGLDDELRVVGRDDCDNRKEGY